MPRPAQLAKDLQQDVAIFTSNAFAGGVFQLQAILQASAQNAIALETLDHALMLSLQCKLSCQC
jgi:hypothetical protein